MTIPMARTAGPSARSKRRVDALKQFVEDADIEQFDVDLEILRPALVRLGRRGMLSRAPQELSVAETAFMDAHSGTTRNPQALVEARIRSEVERATDHAQALSVQDTAKLLDVSPSRVRHRLGDRALYAYPSAGSGVSRLIPRWQFVGGKEIPHLGEVLRALPEEFTPIDVKAFVLNARIDHPATGETIGLVEWLSSGNHPAAAVALAHDQQHTI